VLKSNVSPVYFVIPACASSVNFIGFVVLPIVKVNTALASL
jgi:hypothetical protein